MSVYGEVRAWLRAVALRRKAERDMHAEMTAHIEQAAERFVARGMSERDALHAARREFGNVALIQEHARDSRGAQWVDNFTTDVRYAFRYFARTPLTTVTIVLTMMLGIGGNTAAYSIIHGMYFNPPPGVPNDPSLVAIRSALRGENASWWFRTISYPELLQYGNHSGLAAVAGFAYRPALVDFGEITADAQTATVNFVTPNFFSVLNIPLAAGKGFIQTRFDEHRETELTAILSYALAERQFGTVENAVGRTFRVDDVVVTVIGVSAPRFSGVIPDYYGSPLWMPMSAMPAVERTSGAIFASQDSSHFYAIGRLPSDVSSKQVLPAVRQIAANSVNALAATASSERQRTRLNSNRTELVPLRGNWLSVELASDEIAGLAAVVVFDIIILLVCSTTVSSLLVGAAIGRRHEIGVRLSLGASRQRIVRQLLTESTLLALIGGLSGLLLFAALSQVIAAKVTTLDVTPTWSVALFTAGFAVLVALLCGMSPALHATRHALSDVLKDAPTGTTSRSRLQRVFVVAQIALAQPLLVLLAYFGVLIMTGMGAQTATHLEDRLLIAKLNVFSGLRATNAPVQLNDIISRLQNTPGVRAVTGFTSYHPSKSILEPVLGASANAAANERIAVREVSVSPAHFSTLDIPILQGRAFTLADPFFGDVPAIVNTKFASEFLDGGEPIGRRFRLGAVGYPMGKETVTIVGVVDAARVNAGADQIFTPLQSPNALLIRTSIPAEPLITAIRAVIKAEAPSLPIQSIQSVAQLNRESRTEMLQASGLAMSGGIVTLLLGCVGLYAVVALAVGHRRREIGIRMALGAKPMQVVSMFFKGGLRLSLLGLAIGLPISAAALKIFISQFGAHAAANVVSITGLVATIVFCVAAIATWVPARRAASVDPVVALRAE